MDCLSHCILNYLMKVFGSTKKKFFLSWGYRKFATTLLFMSTTYFTTFTFYHTRSEQCFTERILEEQTLSKVVQFLDIDLDMYCTITCYYHLYFKYHHMCCNLYCFISAHQMKWDARAEDKKRWLFKRSITYATLLLSF